ncbi:YutD family protein [Gordoniibacillus kamchatkensis]|uniref:YutD family protein n=1 Tax=Gordoniibacillus kamchatkensis TaxID=1590651 RepID=UPI0009E2D058|nr:YutD family protein [Paenibacillus sp. VKM B-2647]
MILIGGKAYELITDHKNGWNQEVFRERYSEVLDRYDYVVGDWGYSQMRLRGFFKETNPRATKDSAITCLQDYLNEYCNFGCAYFVLERVPSKNAEPGEGGAFADEASLREETTAAQEDMPRYTIRSQPPQERGGRPQHSPAGGQSDKQGQPSAAAGGQLGAGAAATQPPQGQQGAKPQRQGGYSGPQSQGGQRQQQSGQAGRPQGQNQQSGQGGRPTNQYQQGGRQGQQHQAGRGQGGQHQQQAPRANISAQGQAQGQANVQQPGQSQGQAQRQYGSQGGRHGRPHGQGGQGQQRGGSGYQGHKQPAAPQSPSRDG